MKKLSKNPSQEKVVILGRGALDEKSENLMKKELEKLSEYIEERHTFKSIQTGIYYSYNSKEKLRSLKDKEVDDMVIHTAAKKGNTLVVPFFIGPKYSNMMSLTHFFDRKFEDIDLIHNSEEILLHPNVLHWMKKAANKYLPLSNDETIGVVIMPHGATQPYNDAVERTIEPLKANYRVEMAYGMGDAVTIQNAVHKLEIQGIKKIVLNTFHLKDQIKVFLKEKNFDISIDIIDDGEQILDTGGGIMNMISNLEEKNFLIFNPDTIWNSNYQDSIKQMEIFYQNNKVKNVLLVVNKQLSFDETLKGDFKLDMNKLSKNTNNQYIYTGCQIFSRDLLNSINKKVFSIIEVWNELINKNILFGFRAIFFLS